MVPILSAFSHKVPDKLVQSLVQAIMVMPSTVCTKAAFLYFRYIICSTPISESGDISTGYNENSTLNVAGPETKRNRDIIGSNRYKRYYLHVH
jgi:hypothetical protein